MAQGLRVDSCCPAGAVEPEVHRLSVYKSFNFSRGRYSRGTRNDKAPYCASCSSLSQLQPDTKVPTKSTCSSFKGVLTPHKLGRGIFLISGTTVPWVFLLPRLLKAEHLEQMGGTSAFNGECSCLALQRVCASFGSRETNNTERSETKHRRLLLGMVL